MGHTGRLRDSRLVGYDRRVDREPNNRMVRETPELRAEVEKLGRCPPRRSLLANYGVDVARSGIRLPSLPLSDPIGLELGPMFPLQGHRREDPGWWRFHVGGIRAVLDPAALSLVPGGDQAVEEKEVCRCRGC